MLKPKFLFFCTAVLLFCIQAASAQPFLFSDDSTYIWPTDASPYLSSTFAETRSAHLHAGLDIRTWGREGYKVFATRDGVVYRIGISPRGYGNVIYLKHDDGSFSIYAHLNRFEPKLQSFADSLRLIDYSFELDEHIESQNIHFKQGELIGYTGSTGVGPPHLHFELRTPGYKPFNPLLTNLHVEDTLPPTFTHLGVEFLNDKTLHLEGHEIVNPVANDSLFYFEEITTSGPIGISVNVHDRANRTPNIYAVHSLLMMHESDTLFYSEADYFSYDQSGHMFLDRSYPILAQTRRGFQRLYVVEGNTLPFYQNMHNRGVLFFDEGRYPIKIVASDYYGNKQTAWVTINFEDTSPLRNITYVPSYPLPQQRDDQFTTSQRYIHDYSLFASAGKSSDYKADSYRPQNSFNRSLLSPNKTFSLESPARDLWIQFPENALYDTLAIRMEILQQEESVEINFDPNRLPIQQSVYFNYILPDYLKNKDQYAIFSYDQFRDRLFYLPSQNTNGIIRAELKEISDLRLLKDDTAPWTGRPQIRKNLGGRHVVEIPVKDNLTKIDYRNSTISVNGEKGIVEFDPDKSRLIYYHPDFTPNNTNEIYYKVLDGVGNKTERTSTVLFQP